jgi:periplasmic divalent cation tolerance protein
MYVAWTTVARKPEAEELATALVHQGLAACVQIEGPILSFYRWKGQLERSEEYRLSLKCRVDQLPTLERYVLAHHPYETPEWIVVRADRVGEKYLSWLNADSTNPPL